MNCTNGSIFCVMKNFIGLDPTELCVCPLLDKEKIRIFAAQCDVLETKEARLDAFFCPAGKVFDKRYYDPPSYLYADKSGFMYRSFFQNCWEIEEWCAVYK